jgi:hypothetical protein
MCSQANTHAEDILKSLELQPWRNGSRCTRPHHEHPGLHVQEDNWESPVLGAWGLGWEVWLDGMEVTQFTYFQQVRAQQLAAGLNQ